MRCPCNVNVRQHSSRKCHVPGEVHTPPVHPLCARPPPAPLRCCGGVGGDTSGPCRPGPGPARAASAPTPALPSPTASQDRMKAARVARVSLGGDTRSTSSSTATAPAWEGAWVRRGERECGERGCWGTRKARGNRVRCQQSTETRVLGCVGRVDAWGARVWEAWKLDWKLEMSRSVEFVQDVALV